MNTKREKDNAIDDSSLWQAVERARERRRALGIEEPETDFTAAVEKWKEGKIGDARAVELLIARLGNEDLHVRVAAAEALGELGDARAVDPLIARLGDEDEDVRVAAAEALKRIGTGRALEALKRFG